MNKIKIGKGAGLVFLLALLLLSSIVPSVTAQTFVPLRGQVMGDMGIPLYGVNVTARNATTMELLNYTFTNETGQFEMLVDLTSAQYLVNISVEKEYYSPNSTDLLINLSANPPYIPPTIVMQSDFNLNSDLMPRQYTMVQMYLYTRPAFTTSTTLLLPIVTLLSRS